MKKKLKGKITISRPCYGDGTKLILISVHDELSGISFLEVEIGYSNFAEALTGIGYVDCELVTRNLGNVGKRVERKKIEFELPEKYRYANIETIKKIAKKHIPEGWKSNFYFGSKESFYYKDNIRFARLQIFRYIDEEGER